MGDCLRSVKHNRMGYPINLSPKGLERCQPWGQPGWVMLACMAMSL